MLSWLAKSRGEGIFALQSPVQTLGGHIPCPCGGYGYGTRWMVSLFQHIRIHWNFTKNVRKLQQWDHWHHINYRTRSTLDTTKFFSISVHLATPPQYSTTKQESLTIKVRLRAILAVVRTIATVHRRSQTDDQYIQCSAPECHSSQLLIITSTAQQQQQHNAVTVRWCLAPYNQQWQHVQTNTKWKHLTIKHCSSMNIRTFKGNCHRLNCHYTRN